jgi:hypothetical protein
MSALGRALVTPMVAHICLPDGDVWKTSYSGELTSDGESHDNGIRDWPGILYCHQCHRGVRAQYGWPCSDHPTVLQCSTARRCSP